MNVTGDKWQVTGDTVVGRVCPQRAVGCQSSSSGALGQTRPTTLVSAFTLLEVMIAVGIFFMSVFAILELVSQNLKNVQRLQKSSVDIGSLASELSLTNKLEEGSDSGNFGNLYPGVSWSRNITMVGTNGLFQVDFIVSDGSSGARMAAESRLSIFLYRPESPMGISSGFKR